MSFTEECEICVPSQASESLGLGKQDVDVGKAIMPSSQEVENVCSGEDFDKTTILLFNEHKKEFVEDFEKTVMPSFQETEKVFLSEKIGKRQEKCSQHGIGENNDHEYHLQEPEVNLQQIPNPNHVPEVNFDGTEADMECAPSKAIVTTQEPMGSDLPQSKLINSASPSTDKAEMARIEEPAKQEVINTTKDAATFIHSNGLEHTLRDGETSNVKYYEASVSSNTEETCENVTTEQEPMDVDLQQNKVVRLASPGIEAVVMPNVEESVNQNEGVDTCKGTTTLVERTFEDEETSSTEAHMLSHMVAIQQEHMEMDLIHDSVIHAENLATKVPVIFDIEEESESQKQGSSTCKGIPTGVDSNIVGSSLDGKETSSHICHETSSPGKTDVLCDIVTVEEEPNDMDLPQNEGVRSASPATEAVVVVNQGDDTQKEMSTAIYDNAGGSSFEGEETDAPGSVVAPMPDVEESADQDLRSNTQKGTTGKNLDTVYDNGVSAILEVEQTSSSKCNETSESETSTLKDDQKYSYDCKREPDFTEQNNVELTTGKSSDKMESKFSFRAGDLVWAKVKSHPWWPGQIFDAADASAASRKIRRSGRSLVAFFGDGTYGWLQESQLVPFRQHFEEKIKQTTMKSFCRAVSEALNEVCRRSELGLNCKHSTGVLHSKDTFPDTNAGVQKGARIKSHADIFISKTAFQPERTLYFVKTVACSPLASQTFNLDYPELCGHAYGVRSFLFSPETSQTTKDAHEDTNQVRERAIRNFEMKQRISEFDVCSIDEDSDSKRRKIQQLDCNSEEEKGRNQQVKCQSDSHEQTTPRSNISTQDIIIEEASTAFHSKFDISNGNKQSMEIDKRYSDQNLSQIVQEPGKSGEESFQVNPLETVNENALLLEHGLKHDQESNVKMNDKLTGKRTSSQEDEMVRLSKKPRNSEEEQRTTLQVEKELSKDNTHEHQETLLTITSHTSKLIKRVKKQSVPLEGSVTKQIKTNKVKVKQIPELHPGRKYSDDKDETINNQGNLQTLTNEIDNAVKLEKQLLEKRLKKKQELVGKGSIVKQKMIGAKKATDESMDIGYDRKPIIPKMPQMERKCVDDNSDLRSRDLISSKPSSEKLCESLLELLEGLHILAADPLKSMELVDSRERVATGILKFRSMVFLKSAGYGFADAGSVKTVSRSRPETSDTKAAEEQDSGSDSKPASQSRFFSQEVVNGTEISNTVLQVNAGSLEQYPGRGTLDSNERKKVSVSTQQDVVLKTKKSTLQDSKGNSVPVKNPSSQTGLFQNQTTSVFKTLKSTSAVRKSGIIISPQIRTEKPGVQELAQAARKRKSEVEKEEAAKTLEKYEKSKRGKSSILRHHDRNVKHHLTLETSLPYKRSPERARSAKIPETSLGLFMQFPQGFALPTETQLREIFSQFETAGIRIYENTLSAQVVFKHSKDAELAFEHCSKNRMFETPDVSYKLRHFSRSQRTNSSRDIMAAAKHQLSDKVDSSKPQYPGHSLSKDKSNGTNPGQTEIFDNSYALQYQKPMEGLKNNDITRNNNSFTVTSVSNVNVPSIDIKDQMLKLLHQRNMARSGPKQIQMSYDSSNSKILQLSSM